MLPEYTGVAGVTSAGLTAYSQVQVNRIGSPPKGLGHDLIDGTPASMSSPDVFRGCGSQKQADDRA